MIYRGLANLVVLTHGLFVVFVVLGGFLTWRRRGIAWLHVPCATWGALIEFYGWVCPLTPLENYFRHRAGQAGYGGGFVDHYLVPLIYPAGLTPAMQILLGTGVVLVNLAAYGGLVWRTVRRP